MKKLFLFLTAMLVMCISDVWGAKKTINLFYGATKDVYGTNLNHDDFVFAANSTTTSATATIGDVEFSRYLKLPSYGSSINADTTKVLFYHAQSTITKVTVYVKNGNNNKKKYYINHIFEGEGSVDNSRAYSQELAKNATEKKEYTFTNEAGKNVAIGLCPSQDMQVYQIVVEETGSLLLKGGEEGYSLTFPGRFASMKPGNPISIDNMLISASSKIQCGTGPLKIKQSTTYVRFTLSQKMLVTVKTKNGTKFIFCAAATPTDAEKSDANKIGTGSAGTFRKALAEGTWYLESESTSELQLDSIAFSIPTISYNANGGTGTMSSNTWTVAANSFTAPSEKRFDKWNTANDGTGEDFAVGDEVTANTTLYAIWKDAAASDDATLKTLTLNSTAIALEADKYTYNGIELPWAASVTATYTTNDANATASVDYQSNKVVVTVTAEDKTHTQEYTVNYTIAAAKKDLLEVLFNNGAKGAITNGLIRVPYIAETAEPTFVSAQFWNADGEPTAVVEDGKLKVTGADGTDSLYNIETVAITPASITYDIQITFDSTETYIFNTYDWDSKKGWSIAKDVEQAGNKRISEGRSRMYFALPKAASVQLTSGTGGGRPVKIYVNGVEDSHTNLAGSGSSITVDLNSNTTNLLAIESNGSNGDGGITKITVATPISTAIDNTADEAKAVKRIENGMLIIEKNGVRYNAQGQVIR